MSSSKKHAAKRVDQFSTTVDIVSLEKSKAIDVSIQRAIMKGDGSDCLFNGVPLKEQLQQFYNETSENSAISFEALNFSDFKSLLKAFFKKQKLSDALIDYLIDENLADRLGLSGLDHLGEHVAKAYVENRSLFPNNPTQVLRIDSTENESEVNISLISYYTNAMDISVNTNPEVEEKAFEEKNNNPIDLETETHFRVDVSDAANPVVSAKYSASGSDQDKQQASAVIKAVTPEGQKLMVSVAGDETIERDSREISFWDLSVLSAKAVEVQLQPEIEEQEHNRTQLENDLRRGLQLGEYKWPNRHDYSSDEAHAEAIEQYVSNILSEEISPDILKENPALKVARELARKIIPYYSQNLSYVLYRAISPDKTLSHTNLPKTEKGDLPAFSAKDADEISTGRFYFDDSGKVRCSFSMTVAIKSSAETEIGNLGTINSNDEVVLKTYLNVDMAYGEHLTPEEATQLRKKSLAITIESKEAPNIAEGTMLRSLMTNNTPVVSAYVHDQFKSIASEATPLMRRYAPELLDELDRFKLRNDQIKLHLNKLLENESIDQNKFDKISNELEENNQEVERIKERFKEIFDANRSITEEEKKSLAKQINLVILRRNIILIEGLGDNRLNTCGLSKLIYEKGKTALHYAAEANSPEMVLALVDAGADVLVEDHHGKMAVDYAPKGEGVHQYLLKLTGTTDYLNDKTNKKDMKKVAILTELKDCLTPSAEAAVSPSISDRVKKFDGKVKEKAEEIGKAKIPELVTWFARFVKKVATSLFTHPEATPAKTHTLSPQKGESHGKAFVRAMSSSDSSKEKSRPRALSSQSFFSRPEFPKQTPTVDAINITVFGQ